MDGKGEKAPEVHGLSNLPYALSQTRWKVED